MTHIRPTDRPEFYTVRGKIAGEDVLISDMTQVGDDTAVAGVLAVVSGENETAYVGALMTMKDAFPPLPDSGWLEQDTLYSYGDGVVMVRQGHERTHHAPEDTPALFVVWREGADTELAWIVGEKVRVGQVRIYDSQRYRCIQAHVTQTDWTPPNVAALWELIPDETPGPQPWVQPTGAHDAYHVGDCVTHRGRIWECIAGDANGNNVWEPGVYGWKDIGAA